MGGHGDTFDGGVIFEGLVDDLLVDRVIAKVVVEEIAGIAHFIEHPIEGGSSGTPFVREVVDAGFG